MFYVQASLISMFFFSKKNHTSVLTKFTLLHCQVCTHPHFYCTMDTSRRRRSTVHSPCVYIYPTYMFYVQASPISMFFFERKLMSILTKSTILHCKVCTYPYFYVHIFSCPHFFIHIFYIHKCSYIIFEIYKIYIYVDVKI